MTHCNEQVHGRKVLEQSELEDAFHEADRDGSGGLDREEASNVAAVFGLPDNIVNDTESWRDGKIDLQEFIAMLNRNENVEFAEPPPPVPLYSPSQIKKSEHSAEVVEIRGTGSSTVDGIYMGKRLLSPVSFFLCDSFF